MNRTTKRQVLTTLINVGLLSAPIFVIGQLLPEAFYDRPLLLVLVDVCICAFTVPVWFKVNRYIMRRFAVPREE